MRLFAAHMRLLAAAVGVTVMAAVSVGAASATTSSSTVHGLSVTASLSPDTVSKGQSVMQTASVKNVSAVPERVVVRIAGPLPTPILRLFVVTLKPSASFSQSRSFPAVLLAPGKHTLSVTAFNLTGGGSAQASATVTRT